VICCVVVVVGVVVLGEMVVVVGATVVDVEVVGATVVVVEVVKNTVVEVVGNTVVVMTFGGGNSKICSMQDPFTHNKSEAFTSNTFSLLTSDCKRLLLI
jgi:hypothetical protein